MANPTPTTTWQYVQITSSTNIGPMTTPFQFPPNCTNIYNFHTTVLGQEWSTVYTGGCALSYCCPYSSFYTTDRAWYSSYYSPAVCPEGYQTCGGPWEVASTMQPTEHVRFCCPVSYTCPLWSGYEICITVRTSATTALDVDNISLQHVYSTETLLPSTGSYSPYDYAYPLQIRWKDSDFAPTSTTSPSPAERSSSNHSLSTGAIAGIAVGIGVAALICAVVLAIWVRRHRRRQAQYTLATPELETKTNEEIQELDQSSNWETKANNEIQELEQSRVLFEAPNHDSTYQRYRIVAQLQDLLSNSLNALVVFRYRELALVYIYIVSDVMRGSQIYGSTIHKLARVGIHKTGKLHPSISSGINDPFWRDPAIVADQSGWNRG